MSTSPIVIAIDGPGASGKSTNARLVAQALGYVWVDTGAMYRTLAWHCLQQGVDVKNSKAVASVCRRWKTRLECVDGPCRAVRLLVNGYYPEQEIRTARVDASVPLVAAVPAVRAWMKKTQRACLQFGSLVMEGRDIGTNVFPETEFKFYLDASLDERQSRRQAEGRQEGLAERDVKDSQRATNPLMPALGAKIINTSGQTPEQTSRIILEEVRRRLEQQERQALAHSQRPRW